jgi:hypothetical protein
MQLDLDPQLPFWRSLSFPLGAHHAHGSAAIHFNFRGHSGPRLSSTQCRRMTRCGSRALKFAAMRTRLSLFRCHAADQEPSREQYPFFAQTRYERLRLRSGERHHGTHRHKTLLRPPCTRTARCFRRGDGVSGEPAHPFLAAPIIFVCPTRGNGFGGQAQYRFRLAALR